MLEEHFAVELKNPIGIQSRAWGTPISNYYAIG